MNTLLPLAEFGNYLAFSLLVGHVVLRFIPITKKPNIMFPKSVLLTCTLAIILFTSLPVLQVILFFKNSAGFSATASTVLLSFQVGHVWLFTTVFSIFLWLTFYLNRSKYLQAFWILLMIIAVGYGSHVSTQALFIGLFSHTTHFLMVTIWVGTLLHAAWFTRHYNNWPEFLQWFTPLAIICMINIFATGFVLLFTLEKPTGYMNGWSTLYGRMLLLKHISIIPVVIFAIINGILAKKAAVMTAFEPRNWLKAESIILLFIFYFTGVLGTVSPPTEHGTLTQSAITPTWWEWLFVQNVPGFLQIKFIPTISSLLLILVSLLFIALILLSFRLKSPIFALLFASSFIFSLYLGIMFSCSLYPY